MASVLNIGHTAVKSIAWYDIGLPFNEVHNISKKVAERHAILLVCESKALPFECSLFGTGSKLTFRHGPDA